MTSRTAFAVLGLLLLAGTAQATYEQIRVFPTTGVDREEIFFHPDLELMNDDDGALILLSRPELTARLVDRGFQVEVLIPDLEAFYADRAAPERDYGVWHTYQETIDEMNAIHAEFPDLTTAPASLGQSLEGREIWAMKVSDNPQTQEDEPEVLFDGMHHAREIMSVEIVLHFIRYLCENYDTDPVIAFLVDHRQIWFVPLVNVDGFVYNELTNPNGGGMWRKNRRDNEGSSCYGVDPNRNYSHEWGGQGSSGDPCNDTYRGTAPFSEPCTAVHRAFINAHEFVTWQSYHSVAGQVLIPWGYTTQHTPDDAVLRAIANEMASVNGYDVGQPPEILYEVNGGAFDWGYGATDEHEKIYCFSTEIGGSGFWPDPSEREGLIEENLYSNIYMSLVAGAYLDLLDVQVGDSGLDGRLDPGETADLTVTIENPGISQWAENAVATLSCDDPYLTLSQAALVVGSLGPRETTTPPGAFALAIDPSCPEGRMVTFRIRMEADGGIDVTETVVLRVGTPDILYGTDFESDAGGWTTDVSHNASTGEFVRIDPEGTSYQPEDDTTPAPGVFGWITAQNPGGSLGGDDVDDGVSATRSSAIDLSGATHVRLDANYFFGQRDPGDDSGDFFRFSVSNDGGASYPVDLVQVGDVNHAATWRNLQVDLEEQIALTGQMVFRIQAADGRSTGDIVEAGIDDFYLFDRGDGNHAPSAPALLAPPDGSGNHPANPTLEVYNATDPEADPLTYGFRVYADANLTQLVAWADGIPEGAGSTAWTVTPPLPAKQTYYWRAYAADPAVRGLHMAPASFSVTDLAAADRPASAGSPRLAAGPNPTAGQVHIRYYSPASPLARLEILDVTGRRVRTLAGETWVAGWHDVWWDGRTEDGTLAPSGTYWVRLQIPGEMRSVRVIRVD